MILFLTYIIPVVPFIIVLDGLISAWRTRTLSHIRHLAKLAALTLSLEGREKDGVGWRWTETRSVHTRPFGRMFAITGRKMPEGEQDGEHTDWTEGGDERDAESTYSYDE